MNEGLAQDNTPKSLLWTEAVHAVFVVFSIAIGSKISLPRHEYGSVQCTGPTDSEIIHESVPHGWICSRNLIDPFPYPRHTLPGARSEICKTWLPKPASPLRSSASRPPFPAY